MNKKILSILVLAGLIGTAHAANTPTTIGDTAPRSAFAADAFDQTFIPVPLGITGSIADALFCSSFENGESGACAMVPGPWSTATPGPSARYRLGGTSDGTYDYVYGGGNSVGAYLADFWRWDPASGTWTQLANMPTGKSNIQGSYLNGKIYVPGGYIGSHITENAIYDIATNTWSAGAPLPVAHTGATAAYGGKIYLFGGNPTATRVDVYDPVTNIWTQLANFPNAITYGRAIASGNFIYYVGGISGGTTVTNIVWRYDPATDSYAAMAPLQTARASTELMADGGRIYAVNGGDATFFTGVPLATTVEIYNVANNTWVYGAPTTVTTAGPAGGGAGGKLMIMGGVSGSTYYDTVQVSTLIPQ